MQILPFFNLFKLFLNKLYISIKMADLNKLLVKVPANLCDAFRTKYLTGDGSTPRDTSYDRKIVFLEDTKDIFSQGKIYGTSHAEFEELKNQIEDKSVTLTFGVNSFSNINEEGTEGSDAATHYDAVYKAYTNNGIVKIALNNGNSAILSNIEFTDSINAMGDSKYTIKGILCPSSTTEGVGSNKSYNITFKYDTGDPAYITGYYVSCKEIADTLYNKKVGGTEIQGDSAGTFMETIDPTNATLKTVLQQLLTNDVLLEERTRSGFIDVENFEFNITGGENSIAKEYFDKISNAHGSITFVQSNGSHRAKSSNIEFKRELNPETSTLQETYICTLCSPVSLSAEYDGEYYNKYYCAIFVKNENNYTAKCQEISQKLYNKIYGGLLQIEDTPTFETSIDSANATLSTVLFQLLNNDAWLKENSCVNINLSDYGLNTFESLDNISGSYAEDIFNKVKNGYNNGSTIKFSRSYGETSYGAILSNIEKSEGTAGFLAQEPMAPGVGSRREIYRGILCPFTTTAFANSLSLIVSWNEEGNSYYISCEPFENLGSAAYENTSYFDKAGAATTAQNNSYAYADKKLTEAKQYTNSVLPTVSAGNNINVESTTDSNGKVNYKVSTTATVFNYKGNKTTKAELENVQDKVSGDVWSVGAADSPGSSLYAWDGDEWINIGPADGVVGINNTPSHGIGLTINNGIVGISVTPGSVGTSENFVTGSAVYDHINGLSGSKTSTDGSYVNVTVSTKGGNVSSVSVSESDNLKTAVDNANSALQSVNVLGKTLDKTTNAITVDEAKTYLGLGSAAYKDETYFDKAGAATAIENKLPGVTNGIGIEVSSSSDENGKTTYTIATTSELIRYKGNVDSVMVLRDGTEGDVYSVNNSLLYRYNGGGWSKIAGNIQSINTTSTSGIALTFADENFEGALGISVTTGKVSSSKFGDGDKLVKGYDVYEALCAYTIKDVIVNAEDSTYITVAKNKYSDSSYSYCEISLNEAAIYSYVLDNIWEEFSLA